MVKMTNLGEYQPWRTELICPKCSYQHTKTNFYSWYIPIYDDLHPELTQADLFRKMHWYCTSYLCDAEPTLEEWLGPMEEAPW